MAKHLKEPVWAAEDVTDLVAKASFFLFKDKAFRRSIDGFDAMEQVEQDRIFNEIVVSGLVLAILMYQTFADTAQNEEKKSYFLELATEMESRYGNNLRELKVDEGLAALWKDLIRMRRDEYKKDFSNHKEQFGSFMQINPWPIVVAIGGSDHISRGKAEPEGELFRIFRHWTFNLSEKILKATEK